MDAKYEQKRVLLDYFRSRALSPLPHLHKELELIYVRRGKSTAVVNNRSYSLSDGDVFIAFPYQVHYYPQSQEGEYYIHAFPASVLITMADTVSSNELISNVFHPEKDSPVAQYLDMIIRAEGNYAMSQRCAYLTLIMSELLPQCKLLPLSKSPAMTLRRILEYCARHYTEELSLDVLAKQLHLNKYYISHCVNKQLNMRINAFINSQRIDAACRMLQHSDNKISEIAQAVGYETIRSFNRAFSDIMNMSPKQYRQQHAKAPTE